jgi:hypothetical protein
MTTRDVTTPKLPWDAADPYPFYEARRRRGDAVWDDTAQAWLVLRYHAAPRPGRPLVDQRSPRKPRSQ